MVVDGFGDMYLVEFKLGMHTDIECKMDIARGQKTFLIAHLHVDNPFLQLTRLKIYKNKNVYENSLWHSDIS